MAGSWPRHHERATERETLAGVRVTGHMASGHVSPTRGAFMSAPRPSLGELPEWNLHDLYESGQSEQFRRDLDRARDEAQKFRARYDGKLDSLAKQEKGAQHLAQAIKDFEALDELLGRVGSYAQLYYVENTTDPERSKFYGDISQQLNDIATLLLFFELELNRIDDDVMKALTAHAPLARYKPWIDDLRRKNPYQLDGRREGVSQEKSMTAYPAWNRLFDET